MSDDAAIGKDADIYASIINKDVERSAIAKGGSSAKLAELGMKAMGPHNVTIQTRVPVAYKNMALKGGEVLILKGAYVGKKKTVILKFAPQSPVTNVSFMEYELDAGLKNLEGLSQYLNKYVEPIFVVAQQKEKQRVAQELQGKFSNPLYMSW